ncbi:MAG TPA: RNA 3'-terminal phosphate cyclase [Pseudomonadales bacterium]|nr:RNA 3'-terminal phosphate cyclase [Pseudomonadales bacterium]
MIELDGSYGEGGGQILRSALSLSMCTGTPFKIENIRAKRKKPGLMRQHLTAVQAAKLISNAHVEGAEPGATRLSFFPEKVMAGHYRFAIGTAGSCTLVLQTLLPALLTATEESVIELEGGTHNAAAPSYHFLQRAFAPVLLKMGAGLDLQLARYGFYPAGGGRMLARITPATSLKPLTLMHKGERLNAIAESVIAGVPAHVAQRELSTLKESLNWSDDLFTLVQLTPDQGPGNVLQVTLQHEQVTEVFTSFGEKTVSAESVAKQLVREVKDYLISDGAVGAHLADQLLLPMALAGYGEFTTGIITEHTRTHAEVIQKFLSVEIEIRELEKRLFQVTVSK